MSSNKYSERQHLYKITFMVRSFSYIGSSEGSEKILSKLEFILSVRVNELYYIYTYGQ